MITAQYVSKFVCKQLSSCINSGIYVFELLKNKLSVNVFTFKTPTSGLQFLGNNCATPVGPNFSRGWYLISVNLQIKNYTSNTCY